MAALPTSLGNPFLGKISVNSIEAQLTGNQLG